MASHQDSLSVFKAMKEELKMMREENTFMEALLFATEQALEEKKKAFEEYIAVKSLADDLLAQFVSSEEGNNVQPHINVVEETMRLLEEGMRKLTDERLQGPTDPAIDAESSTIGHDQNVGGGDTNTNEGEERGRGSVRRGDNAGGHGHP